MTTTDPFEMTAKSSVGVSEIAPAGTHPAVLVAVVDLGTQEVTYGDKDKSERKRKVLLAWELVTEKKSGSTENHVVAKDFTLTFSTKSLLRSFVEKWRNKAFAEDEKFNVMKLLGHPCLVTLIHGTSNRDNAFAKVDGVTSVPKGMAVAPPQHKPFCWHIGQGEYPNPDWIPWLYGKPIKEVIAQSDEVAGRKKTPADGGNVAGGEAVGVGAGEPAEEDIPF